MSGTIVDIPLRVCPNCGAVFLGDARLYINADTCPRCGSDLGTAAANRDESKEV